MDNGHRKRMSKALDDLMLITQSISRKVKKADLENLLYPGCVRGDIVGGASAHHVDFQKDQWKCSKKLQLWIY